MLVRVRVGLLKPNWADGFCHLDETCVCTVLRPSPLVTPLTWQQQQTSPVGSKLPSVHHRPHYNATHTLTSFSAVMHDCNTHKHTDQTHHITTLRNAQHIHLLGCLAEHLINQSLHTTHLLSLSSFQFYTHREDTWKPHYHHIKKKKNAFVNHNKSK